MTALKAPFPWFGGKSRIASAIWERFGPVRNYVEPFFGSGAVLLLRPQPFEGAETVNDKDGLVSNFWRAVVRDAEAVAHHADWPVNENDLHARHAWLVGQKGDITRQLEGDPDFFDAKVAGWWCWGLCCWIGSGFCSGKGPWQVVNRQLVHLGNQGRGVNRQLVHLGNQGRGVNRQLVHLGDQGQGVNRKRELLDWFAALQDRLRRVRVCCGDWQRVCGPTPTTKLGLTGVFLDPPYSAEAGRDSEIYREEDLSVAHRVREWCLEHGDDPKLRICLAGYEGEHAMPDSWECVAWKASGGYGSQSDGAGRGNAGRERLWFSPHCLKSGVPVPDLFAEVR